MKVETTEKEQLRPFKLVYHYDADCTCDRHPSEGVTFYGCYCDPERHIAYIDAVTGKEARENYLKTRVGAEIVIDDIVHLPYKWLNVYKVDRAYGGPEEGGWYYDCGQVELSIPLIPSIMNHYGEIMAELEQVYSNEGRREISSVLSEGQYRIKVQYEKGADWPLERPHYE